MSQVAKAFEEGVKAALKLLQGAKIDRVAFARAGDAVRKAMERAVKAAAKKAAK